MLTRAGRGALAAGLFLLALGLVWGNAAWVLAGALPFLAVLAAGSLEGPHGLEVERTLAPARVRVGEVARVRVRVRAARGRGLLEVHCPLPELFELVEGSNLHVLAKGHGPLEASFEFAMRCTRRGTWTLPPAALEAVPALGLVAASQTKAGEPLTLEVAPRLVGLRRVRPLPGRASRIFPEHDEARTGVPTTEFKEIRDYAWGDPPRSINWKATARRQARTPPRPGQPLDAPPLPLVNEYEREGRKTVWVFLDCGAHMQVGSTAENAFEHALHAAGDVAKFYLDRGFTLGFYAYNAPHEVLLHPEAGGRQFHRLAWLLTRLEPGPAEAQGLRAAVERCRAYLVRGRPLVVVVTRLPVDPDGVVAGLRRIRALTARRRRRLPAVVVSPAAAAPSEAPHATDALAMLRQAERPAYARVRALGATVVEWDPRRHPFAAAMWGRKA